LDIAKNVFQVHGIDAGQILFPCTAGAVHTWHISAVSPCPRLSAAGRSRHKGGRRPFGL
jgi:hypothetical protein